jgi:hypothetical protein
MPYNTKTATKVAPAGRSKKQIVFLTPNTGRKSSQKEQELDRATARSHSASVSFRASDKYKKAKTGQHPKIKLEIITDEDAAKFREKHPTATSSPLTFLLDGNSDPFNASPISITPRVNEALSFFGTHYLPGTYGRKMYETRSSAEQLEWDAFLDSMHDECSTLAFVFLQTVNLSQVKSMSACTELSLNRQELSLKNKSFASLREKIGQQILSTSDDRMILRSAIYLYSSAVVRGDFIEATMHGKSLARMLNEREWESPTSAKEQAFVGHMIWTDAHFAQRFMKPPHLDAAWALEKLKPVMAPLDQLMASLEGMFTGGMDEILIDEPLRSFFLRDRFAGWLWTMTSLPKGVDPEAASFWVIATIHLVQGELVNYSLAIDERLRKAAARDTLSADDECYWLTQQSIALGLVFAVWLFSAPTVGGYKIMWTGPVVLSKLRSSLDRAMALAYPSDVEDDAILGARYGNAYLWILSKVAQSEHTFAKQESNPWRSWGNRNFAMIARRLGISSWESVHERLRKFLFHDGTEPRAATWVEKTIKINTGSPD